MKTETVNYDIWYRFENEKEYEEFKKEMNISCSSGFTENEWYSMVDREERQPCGCCFETYQDLISRSDLLTEHKKKITKIQSEIDAIYYLGGNG